MKNIFCIVLVATIFTTYGQKNEVAKEFYSVDELKQDFGVFRASLEEGHPGLYRYKSKVSMDSIFASATASINKHMTEMEFMLLVSKVAAQVGDGHLRVFPSKAHKDKLDEGKTATPFRVYWYDDKLFVLKNYSSLTDKEILGAQIISINGKKVPDILKEYLLIATSDGRNVTNKYRMLSRPRPFVRCLNYLYGYTETYELEYIPLHETAVKRNALPGITFDELFSLDEKRYPASFALPPAEFNITSDIQYAYLRISSFDKEAFKQNKFNFEKFLAASFQSIETRHVKNLILDLRGNGGGTDEYGKILFSYFTSEPFDYYASLRMNKEGYDFFKYTNSPNRKAPKGMLKANTDGGFDNVRHPNVGKQNPKRPTFTGNIFVLINGGCFSTTSEFLSMLQYHTKAIFIGEESGGGYYGNCSGPTPEFFLPNTKVSVEIPLMNYTMAVKEYPYPDRGLIPNHMIIPSIKDKLELKDVELEFAKSLIK
jgi:hypothetical protein